MCDLSNYETFLLSLTSPEEVWDIYILAAKDNPHISNAREVILSCLAKTLDFSEFEDYGEDFEPELGMLVQFKKFSEELKKYEFYVLRARRENIIELGAWAKVTKDGEYVPFYSNRQLTEDEKLFNKFLKQYLKGGQNEL